MFDCSALTALSEDQSADPRLNEQFFRCLPGTGQQGSVLLIGVVHDHPASVFRVSRVIEALSPDVLAVELPPLAVSLFTLYSQDKQTPPRLGGEMSMAIQAAEGVRTVGIDAPNRTYFLNVLRTLYRETLSRDVSWKILKDLGSGFGHAIGCRIGALVGSLSPIRLRMYSHIEHDCTLLDSPSAQAEHERSHVSQRRAFLRAIETPPAIDRIDELREAGMASQLDGLRTTGDVIAIVGMEHLDPVESKLHVLSGNDSQRESRSKR